MSLSDAMAAVQTYNTTGDHTVVVEPHWRQHWIYDGHERYKDCDHPNAIFQAQNWHVPDANPNIEAFTPTSAQIDSLDKYAAPPRLEQATWAGPRDNTRWGKLPVIEQLIYDNKLMDKSTAEIEHEMREARRRSGHRLFDRSSF